MADTTKIEWTDATWNPVTGCSVVSPGCTHCYAMRLAGTRLQHHPSRAGLTDASRAGPVWNGKVRLNEQWLDQPLRWRAPRRIFVCAHGDLFHEDVPDDWIDRVFAVMALAPQHRFQVLTKRADRMRHHMLKLTDDGAADRLADAAGGMFGDEGDVRVANYINGWSRPSRAPDDNPADGTVVRWPLPNVWLGVSVEDQTRANERIPALLATPAALRFVSAEPLLGPVDLDAILTSEMGIHALSGVRSDGSGPSGFSQGPRLDWVITGGESGPGARPMHPDWARALRDQCSAAHVPFFFKQWGAWGPCDHLGDKVDGWPFGCFNDAGQWCHPVDQDFASRARTVLFRAGKRDAGRQLDGREWNEVPR